MGPHRQRRVKCYDLKTVVAIALHVYNDKARNFVAAVDAQYHVIRARRYGLQIQKPVQYGWLVQKARAEEDGRGTAT